MFKRPHLYALLLLLAGAGSASAQVQLSTDEKQDHSVVFYLEGLKGGRTHTVFLNFEKLANTRYPTGVTRCEVKYDRQRLVTLTPINRKQRIGYSINPRVYAYRINSNVNTSFVYRLPTSVARPARVARTAEIVDQVLNADQENPKLLITSFEMQQGDTVYAMRRGHVVEILKRRPEIDRNDIALTTDRTELTIEHADGSLARYIGLDDTQLFVEEDTDVLPGTPLACAGSDDGQQWGVSIQLLFAKMEGNDYEGQVSRMIFFPPFATSEGVQRRLRNDSVYTAVMTDELLMREMSKKEIKRLQNGGKK